MKSKNVKRNNEGGRRQAPATKLAAILSFPILVLILGLIWTGTSLGSDVVISGGVEVGASLDWGSPYDPDNIETFSTSSVDIRVIPDWYGDRWENDSNPTITIHVRPYEPSHLLIFGITEWGELILLYPATPTERIFYEPALLHISMADHPWVTAEDMTIFAVSAPYPLLPTMPRYLVPERWFRLGYTCSTYQQRALQLGFIYEWTGFYWVMGDSHETAWYICNDFWWGGGRHHQRPALGHRVFHPLRYKHPVRHYPNRPRPPHIRHRSREPYQDRPGRERPGDVRGRPDRPNPDKPNPVRISPERPKEKPERIDGKLPQKKPEKQKLEPIKVEKKKRVTVKDKTRIEKPAKPEIKREVQKPEPPKKAKKPQKQETQKKPKKDDKKDQKGKPRSR